MKVLWRKVSEMEVVVRVFSVLLCVISEQSDIKVEMQPSFRDHSAYTDFLVKVNGGDGSLQFIEVKRPSIGVDLTTQTDETAQALREAHIMLCHSEATCRSIQFLLTNGPLG